MNWRNLCGINDDLLSPPPSDYTDPGESNVDINIDGI